MSRLSNEAGSDLEKIETQIQGLRNEVRDMCETLSKLSHEFAKVLLILSNETTGTNDPPVETEWSKHSFS